MASVATLDHVSVTYASTGESALRDVSLRVDTGELLLLAGPSGCGKTTVMRVLNGLVPHAYRAEITGTVTIEGRNAEHLDIRGMSRSVGTLLQNPERQGVAYSVLADIAFGLENRGVSRAEMVARIDEVTATLCLSDDLLTAGTHELSSGQVQLVAFAGILVGRPRLIVADEPLANLDGDAAVRVLQALRDYIDSGGAAIVSEHRVADVLPIGPDRVLYLEDGETRYQGEVAGFLQAANPQSVKLPFDVLVARAEEVTARPNPPSTATSVVRLAYTDAELGYRQKHVVRTFTANLFAGQRIAVLGRNGAGKTTLLRAAVGLVEILGGRVELEGRAIVRFSAGELAARCGYLFQNRAQGLFAATVAEELAFGPRNLGLDSETADTIARAALAAVGLSQKTDIMRRSPRTLSFGEQRRLALALALTLQPRTLILDEPTAGQDERSAALFFDQIATLAAVDAVYFITHDVDMAMWRSDRVLVIESGHLLADGTPSEIVHDTSLWCVGRDAQDRAVLRETDFVRAVRDAIAIGDQIPPPRLLARKFSSRKGNAAS